MYERKYKNGIVAAKHPLAAKTAIEIMKIGGNAVDAAIAAAFVVGVAEPFNSGIGGGGSVLIKMATSDEIVNIDYIPISPSRVRNRMFEIEEGETGAYAWPKVKDQMNVIGYSSFCVPGNVAGLTASLEKWGTMELSKVIEPAIKIAENGFSITPYGSLKITQNAMDLARFPESAKIYLKDGNFPLVPASLFPSFPGDVLIQKDLANTLRRIAINGPEEFYEGETANLIIDDIERNGGVMSDSDLKSYHPRIMKPLILYYRDSQVVAIRSHGGPTVLEMLKVLNEFEMRDIGRKSPQLFHLFAESMKYSFEDRFSKLWDPTTEKVDLEYLLSKENSTRIKNKIIEGKNHEIQSKRSPPHNGQTTHLSVIDKDLSVVSLTQTLLSSFGSKVTIKNTGIMMNNGMSWFNPKPGTLASISPSKVPLSAMSPMIISKEENPYASLGSIGFRRIIGALGQIVSYIVDFGLDMQSALDEPRIDYSSPYLIVDNRTPSSVVERIRSMGYKKMEVLSDNMASSNFSQPTGVMIDLGKELTGGVHKLNPDNVIEGY